MAKRILLCDDEAHILRAAEFKFSRAGYEVLSALDGEEAWEAVQAFHPHIIVTDCQMPVVDGLELAARVRAHPETQHIPIIMLTAKGFELARNERCAGLNILAVLAKPFSPRELFARVEAALVQEEEPQPTEWL